SPAEEAGKNRLREELRKMENADALQHQQQPPPQPPQQQQQEVPAAVAKFLAENPQYADPNDTIAQGEIYVATLKAGRDGLKWDDDNFIPAIKHHLGIAPRTNGSSVRAEPTESTDKNERRPAAPPRQPAPLRMSVPVSAPPTRQVPSMSTG